MAPESETLTDTESPVTVTARAAKEFRHILREKGLPPETAMRLSVKGGGCAGFAYQIDLDRIVSNLVSDTEKNLDALFQAAEASNAVLLFDDTDHLFGSATHEDSRRYPNLNVAQLRQRIEAYDGVVLLCADERAQIDPEIAGQCDEVIELADD